MGHKKKNGLVGGMVVLVLFLSACGGEGRQVFLPAPTPPSVLVNGMAAAGAPLVGQVTVKGALGNTRSAYIEADGRYSVDVDGLTAPYRLQAIGSVGGQTYRLHSYAEAADVNANVNITPFTDLIIANTAQQMAQAFFDSSTTRLDSAELDAQETALQAKLQDVFTVLAIPTAIDLLKSTFSTNNAGLDAALDLIRIEINTATNVATITNSVDGNKIFDNILDPGDNSETLAVDDDGALTRAVSDTQAIVAVLSSFVDAFANGLPPVVSIQAYFSTDFYSNDQNREAFLADITTDSNAIAVTVHGATVADLNATLNTAKISFYFGQNGVADLSDAATWFVAKDNSSGQWQLRGDQRIVDTEFGFHCDDADGVSACGVNTRLWDNDFSNNGTVNNAEIASAKLSIIDGSNETLVKGSIYFGTYATSEAGDIRVFNEKNGNYFDDWKGFGAEVGLIDSSVFSAGDIIQFDLYTEALDTSIILSPQTVGVAVKTYQDKLLFAPSQAKFPTATAATINAMNNFALGDNLNLAWDLAAGTKNQAVFVQLSDLLNSVDIEVPMLDNTATNTIIASNFIDSTALSAKGFDEDARTYELLVNIEVQDGITGQTHSRSYKTTMAGPRFGTGLPCGFDTGWDPDNNKPASFKNYNDYRSIVNVCGGIQPIETGDIVGTWDSSWPFFGTNTFIINANGTLSYDQNFEQSANPARINGEWSISDNIVTLKFGEFTEAWAFYPGGMKVYTEGESWGSDGIFDSGADGHIWTSNYVKQ